MSLNGSTREHVKAYYGHELTGTADLKTSTCCTLGDDLTPRMKAALANVNDEVLSRFYGCGSPLPPLMDRCTVLDLGCGTGRDVFVAAQLTGPQGRVIGVDMTDGQLEVAQRNVGSQMERFGYAESNADFRHGYLEDLAELGIEDASIDIVISNCVLNLSPDKDAVFSEIFRVLKPGGELYFSDVFAGRRVPKDLQMDPVLHGECLAGALYREDFRRILQRAGCPDYRVVSSRRISLDSPEVEARIGMVDFYSETIRAFKIANLEDRCEDYGQVATYRGTMPDWPHHFDLDDHHRFLRDKPMLVCGNTAAMLGETRYAPHFSVVGDRSTHFGPFECHPAAGQVASDGGACC